MRGRVCGVDLSRTPHPVAWMDKCQTIEIAAEHVAGVAIGDRVLVISEQVASDAAWLVRLARGLSWPGEMAEGVDGAAARVMAACSEVGS